MSDHRQADQTVAASTSGPARLARRLEDLYRPVYIWFGYIGAAVLGLLVLAMVYSVVGRRLLGSPLPGSMDITRLSLLIMTATVFGAEHMGHEKMTVDVLVKRFPASVRRVIAPLIYLIALAVLGIVLWQMIAWGIKIQARGETTPGTLEIPKYPFAYLMAAGVFTLIPIYVGRFIGSLGKAVD